MRRTSTRTIVAVVAAAACTAALPAGAMAKQPPAVKQATFKATLSGSQVTTWEYHSALDQNNACSASSDGYGDQTIKFDAGRKFNITFTAPPKNQPDAFFSNGRPSVLTAPILLSVDSKAERNGDYTVNYHEMRPDCDAAAGGGGVSETEKDCGTREGRFHVALYFHPRDDEDDAFPLPFPNEKNNLKLAGSGYEWSGANGVGSAASLDRTYKHCPLLLDDIDVERQGAIFASPAKLAEKQLFNKKRRSIVVSGHHIAKRGSGRSSGQTILAWNLRLTRVK
jgi:hypothetical protein